MSYIFGGIFFNLHLSLFSFMLDYDVRIEVLEYLTS